jgi:DNA-binding transcriptional regulator YhcF (GntR family)
MKSLRSDSEDIQMKLLLNKETKQPIYKQIADQLDEAIRKGILKEGEQLPTELQLLQEYAIAQGTIKKAYQELQDRGLVIKIQGRGTFVTQKSTLEARAEAERLIKNTFIEFESLILTDKAKVYKIFRGKLRERFERKKVVKAALIDCSPEVLATIAYQISDITYLQVVPLEIDEVLENKHLLEGRFDFLVTTEAHYRELAGFVSKDRFYIEKLSLSVSKSTVTRLVKIEEQMSIGILYRSAHFLGNICKTLKRLDRKNEFIAIQYNEHTMGMERIKEDTHVLIVPPDYLKTCSQTLLEEIMAYEKENKTLLVFEYMVDKGSLVHLEEKVCKCYNEKKWGKS